MSPERARELLREADTHRMGLTLSQSAVNAILAATAEERQAALTEAAKKCRMEYVDAEATGAEGDKAYNVACTHCAKAIERLRDAHP